MPRKQSPRSVLLFYRLDQAYSAVADDATAFSNNHTHKYANFIIAVCPTPEMLKHDQNWAQSFWDAMVPHSRGIGSYVNAISDAGVDDRVRASYGAKYDRLVEIKQK